MLTLTEANPGTEPWNLRLEQRKRWWLHYLATTPTHNMVQNRYHMNGSHPLTITRIPNTARPSNTESQRTTSLLRQHHTALLWASDPQDEEVRAQAERAMASWGRGEGGSSSEGVARAAAALRAWRGRRQLWGRGESSSFMGVARAAAALRAWRRLQQPWGRGEDCSSPEGVARAAAALRALHWFTYKTRLCALIVGVSYSFRTISFTV